MWFCFISIKLNNFTHLKNHSHLKVSYFTPVNLKTFMLKGLFSSKISLNNIVHSSALVCFSKIKYYV